MIKSIVALILLVLSLNIAAQNREKAFEINAKLGRGINYGNMFEAPSEAAWGNPWKPEYAGMIAKLGFNHVRIPIRWEPRSMEGEPYTINSYFLKRIKQVVDSVLDNGMFAIINMHHHDALLANPDGQKARFLAQWKQISEYFKDYPDSLLFEVLNEPGGNITPEKWNVFAADAVKTIREDNPERIVLIGLDPYGGLGGLPNIELPDDEFIILTVHYYNPFHFTHQGASWVGGDADKWLGTKWNDSETERLVVQNEFFPLVKFSEDHNIPVHIGEFGAYSKADLKSRVKWTTYISRYIETLHWSWAYWEFSAGFGIYDPVRHRYNQELVDALLHNEMPEPARYEGTLIYKSNFTATTDGWRIFTNGTAKASLSRNDNSLKVSITQSSSENWHIQLDRRPFKLENGKKYRLTFKMKAEQDTGRTVSIYMGMTKAPWSAYSGFATFYAVDTFKTYSIMFDMNEATDNATRISFDLGKSATNLYVKDVVLESVVLVPPTVAPDFEKFKTNVYPNPATYNLYINNLDGFEEYALLNLQGKILKKEKLVPFVNPVDVTDLPPGLYFLKLKGVEKYHTVKVLLN